MSELITLDAVRAALARDAEVLHEAGPAPHAAVAAVLAPGARGAEILLIERAHRAGDRWSGQIALPGGRRDAADRDTFDTAVRETSEEVGLSLPVEHHLGRLTDQLPSMSGGLVVAAHVFALPDLPPALTFNPEVQEGWWVPLRDLADPVRYRDYRYLPRPDLVFPGVAVADPERVVWGLTLRFLSDLFERLGYRVPSRLP
jgi:8-oxo-dGTP pyrophosphatase MutT (NUDIX family)